MMAHTTRSSISVKPRWRFRTSWLPLRIRCPVQCDRLALGMNVENVEPVGRERPRLVPARARPPGGGPGDRVAGQAPEVLVLRADGVADVEPLVEPLELLRVVLLVRSVQLHPHRLDVVDVPLEAIDRRPDLAQRLP